MHADGPRAVGPHGKPVEASASTTANYVGDIWRCGEAFQTKKKTYKNGAFLGAADQLALAAAASAK